MNRIVKIVILIVLIFAVKRFAFPWFSQTFGGTKSGVTQKSGDNSCVRAAQDASEAWGGGLKSYVNPPYDLTAWGNFRSDVDARITSAEQACACAAESCNKTREAMRDLRALVSDLDTAIRNGSSPGTDLVQRQESIDNRIDEAAELVRQGK